jgi:hypothetical protein
MDLVDIGPPRDGVAGVDRKLVGQKNVRDVTSIQLVRKK